MGRKSGLNSVDFKVNLKGEVMGWRMKADPALVLGYDDTMANMEYCLQCPQCKAQDLIDFLRDEQKEHNHKSQNDIGMSLACLDVLFEKHECGKKKRGWDESKANEAIR